MSAADRSGETPGPSSTLLSLTPIFQLYVDLLMMAYHWSAHLS